MSHQIGSSSDFGDGVLICNRYFLDLGSFLKDFIFFCFFLFFLFNVLGKQMPTVTAEYYE